MSRTYHNSSADTQNQGNSLGDRSSVRLSKTRLGEGQGVKDILGGGGGGGNENRFNQNNHNSNEGYSYSKTQSQASKESYGYDKYDKYDNKYEQAAPQYEGGYAPQSQYPQYEAPAPAQSYAPNQFSRKSSHSGMGSGSGKEKESFNLSYDDRGTADWARESDSYQQGQTSSRQSRQAPNSSDEYYDQGPGEDARTVARSNKNGMGGMGGQSLAQFQANDTQPLPAQCKSQSQYGRSSSDSSGFSGAMNQGNASGGSARDYQYRNNIFGYEEPAATYRGGGVPGLQGGGGRQKAGTRPW